MVDHDRQHEGAEGGPAISASAIGMPLTTDFCDPQNTIALSSRGQSPRLGLHISSPASGRETCHIHQRQAGTVATGSHCHRPSATDALKAP